MGIFSRIEGLEERLDVIDDLVVRILSMVDKLMTTTELSTEEEIRNEN